MLIYTDRQWQSFFEAVGRRDIWERDPRFATQAARSRHYDEAYALVAEIMPGRSTAEWLALLSAHDLPAVPITAIEELATNPHLVDSGFVRTEDHPTEGLIRQFGIPAEFAATPCALRRHAPNPGEQTREVLAEAGLAPAQIDALLASGAARQFAPTAD